MTAHILVADDDSAIRVLVARVLRRAGYNITEAVDGQDAIEQLDHAKFDAVVLDVMMPRVDGFGVVTHLVETQPDMVEKTVIVTAFPRTAMKHELHAICNVLSKPFDVRELVSAVEHCVGVDR